MKSLWKAVPVALLLAVLGLLTPAPARAQAATPDSLSAPASSRPAAKTSPAGAFAKGRKRVGFYGGAGRTLDQTYVILGGGMGYYVADGLEVGAEFEGWLFEDPTIWKLSPQIRYTVWQSPRLQPYVGVFYRRTFIGAPYDDFNSYGGRAGVVYRSGRGYAGVGMVYERYDDDLGGDSGEWYPEVSFALYF